ncbi:tRNA uracil 4-sulfurtransferase ThiI [Marinicella litoralis]|uniref:Probable tRNA sulfurtransferase n=1 Tax=Marinicella litoralis TaxID=644220 RepID=A0A4V3DHJ2_9GAMM|nr:tRNA uracil 4-sulfurtransferase ThiI [Marinicella litoralis]TDR18451.1 thiamine biosynthesis protein ThiI [Marinicella litoralis]
MNYRIIVHYAELALKGKNRSDFVKRLRINIRRKLRSLGYEWDVLSIHDRIFVEAGNVASDQADQVVKEVARIPGIAWLSYVHWFAEKQYRFLQAEPDMKPIHDLIKEMAVQTYQKGKSFALKVKRSDKNFRIPSRQLSIDLAKSIVDNSEWQDVDLQHADQFFYVNISSRGISVHTNKIIGSGGLPVSSTGRVLTLLSGGFDSPVAAWLMANRGCNVDFVHFSASHHQLKDVEDYKISRIVKKISEITGRAKLYIVPYTHFDMALLEHDLAYDLILFRRFMARVAERIMLKDNSQALVTGDNLGQVASQTLENINSMNQAITTPILRPLITYNKEQIIDISKQLDLFDVCCEPYKDCCALISKSPKTKSKTELLSKLETSFLANYEALISDTLSEMTEVVYNFGHLEHKIHVNE